MKRIVEDTEDQGLESLLGQDVFLICMRYIYAGKLVAVSDTDAELENAKIVYETGDWSAKDWDDAEIVRTTLFIKLQSIESYASC